MSIFNIKGQKPRQFQYRPRFYDERKERLEGIKACMEAELAKENTDASYTGLKSGFLVERRANSKFRYGGEKKSILRFLIILIAILGIFYIISPEVFMAFWKAKP